MVNWAKSEIFYGSAINDRRVLKLQSVTSMSKGSIPFKYLGVPLFVGAPKRKWLKLIADKVCNKFSKWKGSTLSMVGRLTLINHVVAGSFTHSFFIYKWPASVLTDLNGCIRNFLWT